MTSIHIYAPGGYYIGQIRYRGARRWETKTGRCKTAKRAMAKAVMSMGPHHHRARVLFITNCGYYEPVLMMECVRK